MGKAFYFYKRLRSTTLYIFFEFLSGFHRNTLKAVNYFGIKKNLNEHRLFLVEKIKKNLCYIHLWNNLKSYL